jgi:predicted pyridoxine 5'-phosphate oxidase superfamily flavin-nucleotide-binding protein
MTDDTGANHKPSSDVVFSDAVKRAQTEHGSRNLYARVEQDGGFESEVTTHLVMFMARIDTAFLATASADGQPYIQHRGGPKGFLRKLDDHTIGFIDFAGNRQYVSTGNLSENNRICLFLMDYERQRRIKIWGTAVVIPLSELSAEQRDTLIVRDYRARPEQAMLITVTAWDQNCPQHIPQKVSADRLREAEARIEALENENTRLREELAKAPPRT